MSRTTSKGSRQSLGFRFGRGRARVAAVRLTSGPGWSLSGIGFEVPRQPQLDLTLVGAMIAIVLLGLVMVGSASLDVADRLTGNPYYFLTRQVLFAAVGFAALLVVWLTPIDRIERFGALALLASVALLVLVLVPGVGSTVNGATRWIPLGPVNVQVSEPVKLLLIVYLASYIVRQYTRLRLRFSGFLLPLIVVGALAALLLMQPDFGAAFVLAAIGMGMLFLAGAKLYQFLVMAGAALVVAGFVAAAAPYRVARVTAFLDPWQDPFATGFQLTQSLIAIGSGSWWGQGLGNSVQKLFYLPEAHNDFLFAVFAEEFGFVGVIVLMALYVLLVMRMFSVAQLADRAGLAFGAHVTAGVSIWIGLQTILHIGVNMGVLPTKGLTLPLMSYGGSSLVVTLVAVGLVMRIHHEAQMVLRNAGPETPVEALETARGPLMSEAASEPALLRERRSDSVGAAISRGRK